MKKLFPLLLLSLLACFTFAACSQEEEKDTSADGEKIEITDMADRTVTLNSQPERLLILGSALRLYTYIAGTENLVGVEKAQQDVASGRPYIIAHPELADLPLVGEGFPADPDPERIAQVDPDVIIAGDIMDTESLKQLQSDLGIPVIITNCGSDPVFDDTTYRAMEIIGQVTANEDRVTALIDYMAQCQAELKELTQDIAALPISRGSTAPTDNPLYCRGSALKMSPMNSVRATSSSTRNSSSPGIPISFSWTNRGFP